MKIVLFEVGNEMNMEKSRSLVTVIQYSSSELVLNGLNLFREKHGEFFSNIHIYYVEEIESGDEQEKPSDDATK